MISWMSFFLNENANNYVLFAIVLDLLLTEEIFMYNTTILSTLSHYLMLSKFFVILKITVITLFQLMTKKKS